jgi:ABC-type uncharacterized transport system substrate-binding protein
VEGRPGRQARATRGAESDDFERVLAAIAGKRPDALMTTADPVVASYRTRIVDFAAKHRLLSMYPTREFVDAGGLMFYGGSIPQMYRRAAAYVDKILKGAKPGDLPVEQPTKFDMVFIAGAKRLAELALTHKLPSLFGPKHHVAAGGLMSYSPDRPDLYRRGATYVDKILKGAKPADLPVEQPTKFELVIDLKTARALGLTIPQSILFRADHLIQ